MLNQPYCWGVGMKSIKISLCIIVAFSIALGINAFVNSPDKKNQTAASKSKIQGQDTNCLECATPGSRAALIKKSIDNFEEEKPSAE